MLFEIFDGGGGIHEKIRCGSVLNKDCENGIMTFQMYVTVNSSRQEVVSIYKLNTFFPKCQFYIFTCKCNSENDSFLLDYSL